MCGAAWAWPGDATIVRIEHPVPEFARCKQAFDSDPVGREQTRVRRDMIPHSELGRADRRSNRVGNRRPTISADKPLQCEQTYG